MHTYTVCWNAFYCFMHTHTLGSWQPWLEQVYLSEQRQKNGNLLIIDVLVSLRCCGFINQYQQVSPPVYMYSSFILNPYILSSPSEGYTGTNFIQMQKTAVSSEKSS